MDDLVQALKQKRQNEAFFASVVAEAQAALEADPAWRLLQAARVDLANAKQETEEAGAALRAAALAEYAASGEKHPHPAVTIKMYQVVRYEESLALEYARLHLPQALRLDRGTFEKAAKAVEIPGVEVFEEPRASIAREL